MADSENSTFTPKVSSLASARERLATCHSLIEVAYMAASHLTTDERNAMQSVLAIAIDTISEAEEYFEEKVELEVANG